MYHREKCMTTFPGGDPQSGLCSGRKGHEGSSGKILTITDHPKIRWMRAFRHKKVCFGFFNNDRRKKDPWKKSGEPVSR